MLLCAGLGCADADIAVAYEDCVFPERRECEASLGCFGVPPIVTEDISVIRPGHCTVPLCLDDAFCPNGGACLDIAETGSFFCFERCDVDTDCTHRLLTCQEPPGMPGERLCLADF